MRAPCDEDTRRSFSNLTRDRNDFVRAAVTAGLGRCELDDQALQALARAASDPDPKVRIEAAWAAVRKKGSYLNAQFQRLRARRGPRKAICAVAASILTAAYHMLKDGTLHADPGPDHFRKTRPINRAKALAKQIERLGFTCSISPVEPVSI